MWEMSEKKFKFYHLYINNKALWKICTDMYMPIKPVITFKKKLYVVNLYTVYPTNIPVLLKYISKLQINGTIVLC